LRKLSDYPATTAESDALSADLKRRGFKFMGSTVVYAHMQATGLVNDHAVGCHRRQEIIESYSAR
jgi:DNA-3-methyladenine glycosylase I